MHNCRLTRNGLIDLALDEMSSVEAKQLLAELNDCAACREEFTTLRNTWRVSGQALQSALPSENFWPGYHARLQGKLIQHLQQANEKVSSSLQPVEPCLNSPQWLPIWIAVVTQIVSLRSIGRKLAATSVRVPIPVALVLMFLFGIPVFILFARGPLVPANAGPANQLVSVETRTVEIPVIHEKVVTRVVYVEKKANRSRSGANQLNREDLNAADRLASARPDASSKTAMSLVGFKPTNQVKLTIIKGSYRDEK
jgi:hypothetical protein